jgi:hypothetical protein
MYAGHQRFITKLPWDPCEITSASAKLVDLEENESGVWLDILRTWFLAQYRGTA